MLGGTVSGLVHGVRHGHSAVGIAVLVIDTLRFVVRPHEIAVEPFRYIGLVADVRRILIVSAEFEPRPARCPTEGARGRASPPPSPAACLP